ncbi:MAG TPA: pyridoxal phosphate-dependent aminotransferase [Acidimicrobiales bacterium]|nr:pyridoxal phosphate-dependent aminotransferase [Acidimicrobiales bacterium]
MTATGVPGSFVPPAYPYDRLDEAKRAAARLEGGLIDLSIGTPTDPPPDVVLSVLADVSTSSDADSAARGYPPSIGTMGLRQAVSDWTARRLGATVAADAVAVCVGTKEFVATTPQWLKLRRPDRDTVLYPAVAYPTYEMGATLAGLRAVPVPVDERWRIDLASIDPADVERALMLWVNTPGNPAGGLDDLASAAAWGAEHGVPVFSDECYAEFTWDGPPRTVLGHGSGPHGLGGVVAVHSLSKRSNMAGMRVGWYAGDPDLVDYLREVRKHAGFMVPGPVQRAAVAALSDQAHVDRQRERYRERLRFTASVLQAVGVDCPLPGGGFYLWAPVPGGDEWAWTSWMASAGGALVSPGSFYGPAGAGYVRLAMVAPMERLHLLAARLGV